MKFSNGNFVSVLESRSKITWVEATLIKPNTGYFRVIKKVDTPQKGYILKGDGLLTEVLYDQHNLPVFSTLHFQFNHTMFISSGI